MNFMGGCACGAIRYQSTSKPLFTANCHCRDCQRASGGGSSPVLVVPRAAVQVTGQPKYFSTTSAEGNNVRRGFCPNCGSPLFAASDASPEMLAIKPGSLDDPSWFKPLVEMWVSSAQPWSPQNRSIPRFERSPG